MQNELIPMSNKAYGCISVRAGYEAKVADAIRSTFPDVEAHAVMMMKHRCYKGSRSYSCDVIVPGYVFFYTFIDAQVSKFFKIESVNRILIYEDSDWRLRGNDLLVSQLIFENNGVIGVSSAFMEGDEIKIADGPLKKIEGKIIRICKRSRSAMVLLELEQKTHKIWLPFEWIVKVTG